MGIIWTFADTCNIHTVRAVIQRVTQASVQINGNQRSAISRGFLILLGIGVTDEQEDADWLCRKIAALRICADADGLMNRDIRETEGDVLVVSQFTLHAAYKKGNRPSFIHSARPEQAIPLYEYFVAQMSGILQKPVATGVFGADMQVALVNDGPVTIIMDSRNKE